jgi:hypothetical protein
VNPLQQIPASVRRVLYIVYAILGVALGALAVAHVDHLGSVDLDTVNDVFVYIGAAFGITAASNTFATNTAQVTAPANVTVVQNTDTERY